MKKIKQKEYNMANNNSDFGITNNTSNSRIMYFIIVLMIIKIIDTYLY